MGIKIKKKKKMNNKGKSKKKQLGEREIKGMHWKSVKSKEKSESKVGKRLHQKNGWIDEGSGKTCKREPTSSCGISDTWNVPCVYFPYASIHIQLYLLN